MDRVKPDIDIPIPTGNGIEQARALLQAEQHARVDACKAELEALLAKYRCRLDLSMTLRAGMLAGQIIPQINIMAID
jgi:hypothetical protein